MEIFQSLLLCSPTVRLITTMNSDPYRPFACADCEETFTEAGNRDRHSKIHRGQLYQCQNCSYKSERIDTFRKHKARKHPSTEVKPQLQSPPQPLRSTVAPSKANFDTVFDKRLQLPNNFVYAGSTQSVSFRCCRMQNM